MRWLYPPYLGEKVKSKAGTIGKSAEYKKRGKYEHTVLLVLSDTPGCQLELLTLAESRKPYYRGRGLTVVGLAANRKEAISLLETILNDCLLQSGQPDVRAYLASLPKERFRLRGEAEKT